ncbi:dephospho-CoA kinase [Jannaschia sp. CCS1]|uniref:Dephospho-CoA kinase n=1 Tax=Jannaschia sp. (strain CCS1) TaxID=290400 RepID=COAE_JANSC|nr:dephospho-CoA kinase [Jannaschia sp. CCS1]Q28W00.1 RecName: Full=Dephospho-CoA kinase; AltName: Full=Dephosphocoenzyme A kinase [Jannaschia sp. CCS1]ABD53112.1 Dephospho-CoA kinase [Jannaschia sp. CCS1]
MSFALGLTGSIGMGKSTTAAMFRDLDVPVWDADATVHKLYARGGAAVAPIDALVPGAMKDGAIDRAVLRAAIADDASLLKQIEAIVHPLVAKDRAMFRDIHSTAPLIILDIPLLFETGGDAACDATLVVTTSPEEQRRRVLARGTSEDTLHDLLSRQMPDAEKRARATYVIETDTLDGTRQDVAHLVSKLTEGT